MSGESLAAFGADIMRPAAEVEAAVCAQAVA